MNVSAYDLVYTYFESYAPASLEFTQANRRKVLTRVNELLDSGWTAADVLNRWIDKDTAQVQGGNLMKSTDFYWHNSLRLIPGPTKVILDIDSGTITRHSVAWFLEMKASFTLDDAVDYYLNHFGLTRRQVNFNKYVGTFRHLLTRFDVDMLLFMVDACANWHKDSDHGAPLDPINLTEFERNAQDALNRKITEARQVGSDKVVPRTRLSVD